MNAIFNAVTVKNVSFTVCPVWQVEYYNGLTEVAQKNYEDKAIARAQAIANNPWISGEFKRELVSAFGFEVQYLDVEESEYWSVVSMMRALYKLTENTGVISAPESQVVVEVQDYMVNMYGVYSKLESEYGDHISRGYRGQSLTHAVRVAVSYLTRYWLDVADAFAKDGGVVLNQDAKHLYEMLSLKVPAINPPGLA